MLLAILFFLVCAMVGAVVLTAAATNAGRLARNRQEQQDYLAVASAAKLVREDITGGTFTGSYREIVTEIYYPAVYDQEGNLVSAAYTTRTVEYRVDPVRTEESVFLSGMKALLESIYFSTVPAETGLQETLMGDTERTLALETSKGDAVIPTVSGNLRVASSDNSSQGEGRYAITAELAALRDGTSDYPTVLKLAPRVRDAMETEVTGSGNTTIYTTTYTTTVTWTGETVTKGAPA